MLGTLIKAIRTVLPYLALLFAFAWIVDFFWFQAQGRRSGGSALGGLIVAVGAPVAILCFAFFLLSVVFPALMGLRQGPAIEERVRRVQTSGERLGGGRCGGYLSDIKYNGPLLSIQVYPGGIIIRPLFASQAVIFGDEVRRIEWKSRGNCVEITHQSPDIKSPITLYVATWTDVGAAIKAFEERLQASGSRGSSG